MKLTKTLSGAIAATTILGAIGFAVAQTTDTTKPSTTSPSTTSPSSSNMQNGTSSGMTAPAAGSTAPSSGDMSTSTEPAAKADRN